MAMTTSCCTWVTSGNGFAVGVAWRSATPADAIPADHCSYARGTGWNWEYFFHMIEPVATRVPYMASIGNRM